MNTPKRQPPGRRLAVAGVLTAAVLAGGAGFAYAGNAQGNAPVESGYATVVDEGSGTADGVRRRLPRPRSGGGSSEGSEGPERDPERGAEPDARAGPDP